ncbi:MAG: D-arabinono-1,4-lactone oxidase [Saprospiraceae bacterium]
MDSIVVNGATYWLPANEREVMDLVEDAHSNGEVVCLRGAAHSFPIISILEQGDASGRPYRYVMLAKMNAVAIDAANKTVTVQGGCHLGLDPWDPTKISTLQNSLLFQLDQAGFAIPDLGGIIHQTVAGFMSTCSSGGTTEYAFQDSLQSVSYIHYGPNGVKKTTFVRPASGDPNDPFFAAGGASLGLFGVLVSATFNVIPKFNIKGFQATTTTGNCAIDLFGGGTAQKPSLEAYFQKTTYSRLIWWPQSNVDKFVVWQAEPITPQPDFKPIPYQEVPYIFNSPIPATLGADLLFTAIGRWPNWLEDAMGDTPEYRTIRDLVGASFYPLILPKILDIFVALDPPGKGPTLFQDYWWSGLPMDNQMSDRLFPVRFTELWIPLDQAQAVMNTLHDFYNAGPQNTMAFCCEIYAAKKSPCWLSPAYDTDVIRIDVFWFGNNSGDPTTFYQKFWDLLAPFKFRPHWGKYLPAGDSPLGANYLRSVYPKWDAWMQLRQQLDPDQVFVNDYWRGHLGIQQPVKTAASKRSAGLFSNFFNMLMRLVGGKKTKP